MKKIFAVLIMLGFVSTLPSYSFTLDDKDYSEVITKAKEAESVSEKSSEKSSAIESDKMNQEEKNTESSNVETKSVETNSTDIQNQPAAVPRGGISSLKDNIRTEILGGRWVYPNESQEKKINNTVSDPAVQEAQPAEQNSVEQNTTEEQAVQEAQPAEQNSVEQNTTEEQAVQEAQPAVQKSKRFFKRPVFKK